MGVDSNEKVSKMRPHRKESLNLLINKEYDAALAQW
jgi:hypothetical protein